MKNKIRGRRNTQADKASTVKGKLYKQKPESRKLGKNIGHEYEKGRPRAITAKIDTRRVKKRHLDNIRDNLDDAVFPTPNKEEPTITITDSDSKKFFDEVFDDAKDLETILLDMPLIAEEGHHIGDYHDDDCELEIKREIQTMRHSELKTLLPKDFRNFNPSDDEEGSCDVGDETSNDDHSSVPKPSMKTRTIRDINSKNDNRRFLSPIRENEALNDSHEFIVENNINISDDDQMLAKSYQNQKDWKKLEEMEKYQESLKEKNLGQKLKNRNKKRISAKTFKMKSHILLPSKLQETIEETKKRESQGKRESPQKEKHEHEENKIDRYDSGELSPPFDVSKEVVMEFSQAIEDFNMDLIDQADRIVHTEEDADQPILIHARSEKHFDRRLFRHNINSVIERDHNLLEDLGRERGHSNYSIGDDIRTSHERSEVSSTTKNINVSFDEDTSNRREEIEASIESLELKASMLLNDDDQMLKLCQAKVKEYFEKCMENENTSDEEVKKYIHSLLKSKQNQSPAVGDLNSFEKINEIVTVLSKIQYQLIELDNL